MKNRGNKTSKVEDVSPNMSVVILCVKELSKHIRRQRLAEWTKTKNTTHTHTIICFPQEWRKYTKVRRTKDIYLSCKR